MDMGSMKADVHEAVVRQVRGAVGPGAIEVVPEFTVHSWMSAHGLAVCVDQDTGALKVEDTPILYVINRCDCTDDKHFLVLPLMLDAHDLDGIVESLVELKTKMAETTEPPAIIMGPPDIVT